jgi:hypothetical protein
MCLSEGLAEFDLRWLIGERIISESGYQLGRNHMVGRRYYRVYLELEEVWSRYYKSEIKLGEPLRLKRGMRGELRHRSI